mgnify:FL=1
MELVKNASIVQIGIVHDYTCRFITPTSNYHCLSALFLIICQVPTVPVITTLDSVSGGVTSWKERVKSGDTFTATDGHHFKVRAVILLNKEHVVLECQKYQQRDLDSGQAAAGCVYRGLSQDRHYMIMEAYKHKYKAVEQDGNRYILLPLRKKQCHWLYAQ